VGIPRVTFPLYFWALNANCSNTVKVTDFKFDKHITSDTPDMTPLKFSKNRAWSGTHDPQILGLNAVAMKQAGEIWRVADECSYFELDTSGDGETMESLVERICWSQ